MKHTPQLLVLAISLLVSPAFASTPSSGPSGGDTGSSNSGTVNVNAVSPNQAANNQYSSGYVNQSPVGGINSNVQYNNSANTDYGFGGGIVCRAAHLSVGGFANGNSGYGYTANGFGGIAALNIPLGGQIGSTCAALAAEKLQQAQLDTCITLVSKGIVVDPTVWPQLARCEGLSMRPAPVVITPRPTVVQSTNNRPIRGMW